MKRTTVSGIMLTLLLTGLLTLAFNVQPVEASVMDYIGSYEMKITPESPTIEDNVYVTVSFTTASASYSVDFISAWRSGDYSFETFIAIRVPTVTVPETGHAEKTYDLGKLPVSWYVFTPDITVYNSQGDVLSYTLGDKRYYFAVGAVQFSSTLAAPRIVDDSLVQDSIFRVEVTIDDVEKLWGYEFGLSYDPNVLSAIDYGSYDPFNTYIYQDFNDAEGYVHLAIATFYGDWEGFSTTDPTPVAWIDFYVDSIGTSVLDFTYSSMMVTVMAEEVPHNEVNGLFDNRPQVITTTIDIGPDTLNLGSKGNWITAYIQLPQEYNAADINATTILLNGTMSPILDTKYGFVTNSSEYLVDHDGDGILERMIKFDMSTMKSLIYDQGGRYGYFALTIGGKLFDGTLFEGTDVVFVNFCGDVNNDGMIDVLDAALTSAHWYPGPPIGPLGFDSIADLNNDGVVNIQDASLISANWGETLP